jgi:serine/threonine-protein kinase
MKDLAVGQVLGRYELLMPVAKGGMAQVWAARLRGTRGFQKIVAVKTILPGDLDDERAERMFLEEATLASQIHHPNVVGTLELGEENGLLYLVMEWVEGESLNFIMRRAADGPKMPLPVAVNLIGQACKGLHAAHDLRDESGALLGVVHRDISAQNVLVTYSGNAKIVDFGIAKVAARASALTEAGEIKGKFAYLAPEQALAQPVDRRTDIFSMGILLYYLTTGRHPFRGTTPGETLRNICSTPPAKRPSEIVADYPPELESVVEKALQKSPDDRWPSAHDMLSALERAIPQCLDGSFEIQVASYMSQLLGNRSRERRTELRLAQQMLDGTRADGVHVDGSSGSLRALALGDSQPREDSQSKRKTSVEIPVTVQPATVRPGRARRWTRAKMAAGGALVGAILAVVVARQSTHGPSDAAAPAASPVPAAAVPSSDPRGEPAARIAPPAPPPAPIAAAPAADDVKEGAGSKRGPKKAAAPAPRASASPALAPAASAANISPPPAERPRPETRDGSSSAWDPGTFGGRR